MNWIEIECEEDIQQLNNTYGYFGDSYLVKMDYTSGDFVNEELEGHEGQTNDLRLIFQRLDRNPFSIELWFEHTKRINMFFHNGNKFLSDIMFAKVCKNNVSYFWTVWKEFNPNKKEHLELSDVYFIEADSVKWRIIEN